jgi:hypothetical protein
MSEPCKERRTSHGLHGARPNGPDLLLGMSNEQCSGNQVEWAMRIRHQIHQEFDRVAAAFRVVAQVTQLIFDDAAYQEIKRDWPSG